MSMVANKIVELIQDVSEKIPVINAITKTIGILIINFLAGKKYIALKQHPPFTIYNILWGVYFVKFIVLDESYTVYL